MELNRFEFLFEEKMRLVCDAHPDPSHDLLHVRRVVKAAKELARKEGALLEVVVPAAYLHDVVYVSKADPRRSQASKLSADEARRFLAEIEYPSEHRDAIAHAIEAHSFSAAVATRSLEARIVQDADRLDALGAIGIARALAFSGLALRPIYAPVDPFAELRELDDSTNTLDHFFVKLFKLPERMHTASARSEAERRCAIMRDFVEALRSEI
jgi:uncharacterized protein